MPVPLKRSWDVLSEKNNEVAAGTVSQFTYEVNHLGQRTGVTTTGSAFANVNRGWSWGYDALGQVTKAVHADAPATLDRAYTYDNIGNRTSSTDGSGGGAITVGYTPDKLNQYDTINPGAPMDPVYDLDGNLKEDAGINAMGYGLRLEWDAENRVTAIRKADNTLLVTYVYDHLGRRIRKTTTAAAYQGASDIAYLYDGWNVVAEYTIASGPAVTLAQAYTWGLDLSGSWQGAGGVGGLLCIHRGPGTDGSGERTWTAAFYPTYDGNGNISEYLEYQVDIDPGTSGNQPGTVAVAHFEYDPFGRIAASSGAVADFNYRFSTKPQDIETGLYYYGYRYYDPVTGRWPSRDPMMERGGENLYAFVLNKVSYYVDRLGLEPVPATPAKEFDPDLGTHNKDKSDKSKKGNCASFPFREKLFPADPNEFAKRGCKMVEENEKCKDPTPKRLLVAIAIDEKMDPLAGGVHVIAQECGKDTYEHQAGDFGPVFDQITDPNKAVNAYFKDLIKGKKLDEPKGVITLHFCCPCEKEGKGGESE